MAINTAAKIKPNFHHCRESARAKMRMIVKKLLKKYKYPPEGQEDALKTVISQCEMWTDNIIDISDVSKNSFEYELKAEEGLLMVAEPNTKHEI